jgi:hypothetical protein
MSATIASQLTEEEIETTDDLTSQIRKDQHFLVLSSVGPLVLTKDKDRAIATLKLAKSKGKLACIVDINASSERVIELGINLFKRKPISEEDKKNMLNIRNSLIREFIDYRDDNDFTDIFAWKRIAKKHNLEHKTYEEWNQWTMDIIEYNVYNNPKFVLR